MGGSKDKVSDSHKFIVRPSMKTCVCMSIETCMYVYETETARARVSVSVSTGYLSFGPMAQYVVHALKGLTHAEVTKTILFFQWVQNLGTPRYMCMIRTSHNQRAALRVEAQLVRLAHARERSQQRATVH